MLAGTFNSSNGSLTAVVNGGVYSVDKQHPNYKLILEAYKKGDTEDFLDLYTHKKSQEEILVKEYVANSGITLENGKVYYNNKEVHHSYAKRILEAQKEGFPIKPMVAFFENLLQNPSCRSVEELPDFLMNRNLPLTEDGCFLAYKSVQSDWYSKATGDGSLTLVSGKEVNGKIYNGIGEVIECVRNEVDDNREHECSKGLHVGGLAYSGPGGWYNSYNDKVVIVKVNPRDVVSVPKDHNAQKVRVCKYEVVEEFKNALNDCCEGVEPVKEEPKKLEIKDLKVLDEITFLYLGKNDKHHQRRFMIIEEIHNDYIFGVLLENDPSYEEGNESRKFMLKNIEDITVIDEDYDYEDEDCDEEDYDYEDEEGYDDWNY